MENPNFSKEHLQVELKMHFTAAKYLIKQLFERHPVVVGNPDQLTIDDELLGIGAMSPEDLPDVG